MESSGYHMGAGDQTWAGYMQSKRFIHCTIAIDLDMPLFYLFLILVSTAHIVALY